MDIFPTSFKLAGGTETPNPLDGKDLLPYITGQASSSPHQVLFWRKLEQAAVRTDKWKLIRAEGLDPMLYRMDNDRSELNDMAHTNPEKVQELSKLLTTWEQGAIEPLWQEGKGWVPQRKKENIKWRDAKKVYPTLNSFGKDDTK